MRFAAEFPSNFGRVELYAGTPLLARMAQEGKTRGDYLSWDYTLNDAPAERVFQLSMRCFETRNFGLDALANRIMGTRFDVEVARKFHPDLVKPEWIAEGQNLSRVMSHSSADSLERIVRFVRENGTDEHGLVEREAKFLRAAENAVRGRASALAYELMDTIQRGKPLTFLGDRVATPLQRAREVA
jgi:hypothetical protein